AGFVYFHPLSFMFPPVNKQKRDSGEKREISAPRLSGAEVRAAPILWYRVKSGQGRWAASGQKKMDRQTFGPLNMSVYALPRRLSPVCVSTEGKCSRESS
ncbi:hypothetical protein KUCAC02_030626, partial [Chaenocephalus aceratus]